MYELDIKVFSKIENNKLKKIVEINNNSKKEDIISLLKKVHRNIPNQLIGQSVIFWVFHVIRNYNKFESL